MSLPVPGTGDLERTYSREQQRLGRELEVPTTPLSLVRSISRPRTQGMYESLQIFLSWKDRSDADGNM